MATGQFQLIFKPDDGAAVVITNETVNADLGQNLRFTGIAPGQEKEFTFPLVRAKVRGYAFGIKKTAGEAADKTATATLRTNSLTVPGDTFLNVTATNGRGWSIGDGAITLAADVTKIFVTNDGTGNIDVVMYALIDATP